MATWARAQAEAADAPVPYTLTGQAEAALDAEPEPLSRALHRPRRRMARRMRPTSTMPARGPDPAAGARSGSPSRGMGRPDRPRRYAAWVAEGQAPSRRPSRDRAHSSGAA